MKIIRTLAILVLAASLIGFVVTFPVTSGYQAKAQFIQRVQVSDAASLFDSKGDNIGSAQKMIIEDPKAFLEGKTPEGAKMVSESYLKEHNIYPLQLQTVEATASLFRLIFGVAGVVALLTAVLINRKLKA